MGAADEDPLELLQLLRRGLSLAADETQRRWNRVLPSGDQLVDRWDKAKRLGFGAGSSVYDSCLVLGDVHVGDGTWIGPFTVLDGSGGLEIGDGCTISAGVHIYTHDNVSRTISGGVADIERSPVRIGNRCYIGPHAVIARGVTIGDRCVIGAHSLVDRDIAAGMKAWGVPCRVIGRVAENG